MPLHGAGEAFTDGSTHDIDTLTINEMVRKNLGSDIDHRVRAHPKLGELTLRLDLRLGEMSAHLLAGPLNLGGANAKLKRGIAVALFVALSNDLTVIHLQHGDGNMNSLVREHPGHSDLASDQSTTHWIVSWPKA